VPPQAASSTCTCCSDEKKRDDIITYSFPSFHRAELSSRLAFLENASASQGALQLTPDSINDDTDRFLVNQSGSTLLLSPVKLWHVDSHGVKHDASFNTSFTMILYRVNETYLVKGEGLAFVIAPTLDGPPPGSSGGFLGLTNSTGRATSGSSFVAVEFNTHYTTANN